MSVGDHLRLEESNGDGILITAQLLAADHAPCTRSIMLPRVMLHSGGKTKKQNKSAFGIRICGYCYLWPASLPKEPMVRRGLEGLTQVGSGVFCTSVLTSGSISEGEGVSFAPAMPPECLPPAEGICCCCRLLLFLLFLLVSERAQSPTDAAEKPHSGLTGAGRRRRESVSPPAASASASGSSSLPPSLMEIRGPGASERFTRRHDETSTGRPTRRAARRTTRPRQVKHNDPRFILFFFIVPISQTL